MKLTKDQIGKTVTRINHRGTIIGRLEKISCDDTIMVSGTTYFNSNEGNEWKLVLEREQGLSLLEAMQSGKEFRKIGADGIWSWYIASDFGQLCFSANDKPLVKSFDIDMLSARYELKPEPKKVEITADMLDKIATDYLDQEPQNFKSIKDYQSFLKSVLF